MYILTLFVSTLNMFSLKISKKSVGLGGQKMVCTTIDLVLGNNNSKSMFSMTLGKMNKYYN